MSFAYALKYTQDNSSGDSGEDNKSSDAECDSSDDVDLLDFLSKERWKMACPDDEEDSGGEKRIPPAVENALADQLNTTVQVRDEYEPRETESERDKKNKGRRVKLSKDGKCVTYCISLKAATMFIDTSEGLQLTEKQMSSKTYQAGKHLKQKNGSMTFMKYQWTFVDAKTEGEEGFMGEPMKTGKHTKVCRLDTNDVRMYSQIRASCCGVLEVITQKPHEKVFAQHQALQEFLLKYPENSKRKDVLYSRVLYGLRAENTDGGMSEHTLFGFKWTLFQP